MPFTISAKIDPFEAGQNLFYPGSNVVTLVFMLLALAVQLFHLRSRFSKFSFGFRESLRELIIFLAQLLDTRHGSLNSLI
jgi:hypothetical protein